MFGIVIKLINNIVWYCTYTELILSHCHIVIWGNNIVRIVWYCMLYCNALNCRCTVHDTTDNGRCGDWLWFWWILGIVPIFYPILAVGNFWSSTPDQWDTQHTFWGIEQVQASEEELFLCNWEIERYQDRPYEQAYKGESISLISTFWWNKETYRWSQIVYWSLWSYQTSREYGGNGLWLTIQTWRPHYSTSVHWYAIGENPTLPESKTG